MVFKVVFLAHAPDGEPEKHRCVIETSKYKLSAVVVRGQDEAVEVCKKLVKEEIVQSILFYLGFTHRDVAEISEAVRENVGVFAARGYSPSNRVSGMMRKREDFVD